MNPIVAVIIRSLQRRTLYKKFKAYQLQTVAWDALRYKVTGVVTNREIPGDELIWWYRGRCGKSEEAHSILKEDLAGGHPSNEILFEARRRMLCLCDSG